MAYENGNDIFTPEHGSAVLTYEHAGRIIVKVVPIHKVREDGRIVWHDGKQDRFISPKGGTIRTVTRSTQKIRTTRDVSVKHDTPENLAQAQAHAARYNR